MGLMSALFKWPKAKAERVTETGTFGWQGGRFPLGPVAAGEIVTPNTALAVSAVYASVRLWATIISTLPLKIYQTMPDGTKREAPEHPLNEPLRFTPNDWQDRVQFLDQGVTHLQLRGNMYARIISGPNLGAVDELLPIHPDAVKKIERLENGRLRYQIRGDDNVELVLNQDEIFHVRGPISQDGIYGMSPITAMREGIGLSIAAERYGGKFFANSAMPSLAISVPKDIQLSKEGAEFLRQEFINRHGGDNQLGPAVLRDGMTIAPLSIAAKDAQYIELREFQVSDIARIFGVPPHLIGDLKRATFSNVTEATRSFADYFLCPSLVRLETAMMIQLMSRADRKAGYYIKFSIDGLLRGDIEKRFAAYAIGIPLGIYNPNEVRELEDMNRREGGDEFVASQNTRPSGGGDGGGFPAPANDDDDEEATAERGRFVADAAKRIANAEIREIGKHIKHAATDRDTFNEWLKGYLSGAKHQKYIRLAIGPFGCDKLTVDLISSSAPLIEFDSMDQYFGWWKSSRADQIAAAITEGTTNDE